MLGFAWGSWDFVSELTFYLVTNNHKLIIKDDDNNIDTADDDNDEDDKETTEDVNYLSIVWSSARKRMSLKYKHINVLVVIACFLEHKL